MPPRGRFGKYGETKRLERLRRAGGVRLSRTPDGRDLRKRVLPQKKIPVKEQIVIRPARSDDAYFVGRLSGALFTVYGPYEDTISHWFRSGKTFTLIAVAGRRPVGFAMVSRDLSGRQIVRDPELLAIAVEPAEQQTGIGRMLLGAIEDVAARDGATRIFLHTATENVPAQKLFIRNGYRPLETEGYFYPAGQDAVVMFKHLNSCPIGQEDLSF